MRFINSVCLELAEQIPYSHPALQIMNSAFSDEEDHLQDTSEIRDA